MLMIVREIIDLSVKLFNRHAFFFFFSYLQVHAETYWTNAEDKSVVEHPKHVEFYLLKNLVIDHD